MRRLFLKLSNKVDLALLPVASKILWVETSEIWGEHQRAQSNKISDWVRVARIKKATVDIRKGRGFMPLSGFARILSRLWHSDVCSSSLSRLICFLWGEPLLVCCACLGTAFGQARVLFWFGSASGRGFATYCRVLFWFGSARPSASPHLTKIKPCNKWLSRGLRPHLTKIKPWPGQMPCLGKHNIPKVAPLTKKNKPW